MKKLILALTIALASTSVMADYNQFQQQMLENEIQSQQIRARNQADEQYWENQRQQEEVSKLKERVRELETGKQSNGLPLSWKLGE